MRWGHRTLHTERPAVGARGYNGAKRTPRRGVPTNGSRSAPAATPATAGEHADRAAWLQSKGDDRDPSTSSG